MTRGPFVIIFAAALTGCVPTFDDDGTRIDRRRVIAIRATPAEVDLRLVTASRDTTLEAVVADPLERSPDDVSWTLCIDRKPLSELGPVSERCLASPSPGEDIAVELGRGASVPATLPELACQLFGPERPDPKPGEPAGRPVDPDPTGGFYQPVLAWLDGEVVLGGVRMTCGLFNVSPNVSIDFTSRYRPNENPELERLELVSSDGSVAPLDPDEETSVLPSARYTLRALFPACPTEPVCGDGICSSGEAASDALPGLLPCPEDCSTPSGCGGAETYVVYDPESERVETRRESLVVSWFATAGTYDSERTGDTGPVGPSRGSSNGWVAPAGGRAKVWAVLRDNRGGSAIFQANLAVAN